MKLLPHAHADFMRGVHHEDDEYRMALYESDPGSPEIYDPTHECQAAKSGIVLTNYRVETNSDGRANLHFSDIHLDGVTLRYRYAVLFNASKGGRTIQVIDIGKVVGVEGGLISIHMPEDGLVEFGSLQ